MSNINELLASVVLYSLISYLLNIPDFLVGLIFATIASQISTILPSNYKTSLLLFIPIIIFSIKYPTIMIALTVGYASSIIISLLSKNGCKLLYPIGNITFTGPANYIQNDTKGDYAATVFLVVLAITSIIFSMYGMDIISTLNETNTDNIHTYFTNQEKNTTDNRNYVHYVNINPTEVVNKNITTIHKDNTTTTIVSEYNPNTT